jgi:Ca2+-binding RTX toxin-like protein
MTLVGGAGDDFFQAGEQNIVGIESGVSDMALEGFGGDGNDTLLVSGLFVGSLTFIGGAGDDSARFDFELRGNGTEPLEASLTFDGGDGNDSVVVSGLFAGTLTVIGGAGDDDNRMDMLSWLPPASNFEPGALLDGGPGLDILIGSSGNDTISGGADSDTLTGGPGNDKFVFESPREGPDSVTDFTPGVDKILVSAGSFGGGLAPGALAADQFVSGSDPLPVGGQGVFLYDTADGTLSWDADGDGGNAPVTIAILLNQPALSASDFLIF